MHLNSESDIIRRQGPLYEDPLLPGIWFSCRDLSYGRAGDKERVLQQLEARRQDDYSLRIIHILGVKPISSSSSKSRYETGEAALYYFLKQATDVYFQCGYMHTRIAQKSYQRNEDWWEDPPPPYSPTRDRFKDIRFEQLQDVVAFYRHDIEEVVLRKDWSEKTLCNDIVVTAVYSQPIIASKKSEAIRDNDNLRLGVKEKLWIWLGGNRQDIAGEQANSTIGQEDFIRTGEFAHAVLYLENLGYAKVSSEPRAIVCISS